MEGPAMATKMMTARMMASIGSPLSSRRSWPQRVSMTLGRPAHKGVDGQVSRISQAGLLALLRVAVAPAKPRPTGRRGCSGRRGDMRGLVLVSVAPDTTSLVDRLPPEEL